MATDRALADSTNTLQEAARQDKQQAAKGGCLYDHVLNMYSKFMKYMCFVALNKCCSHLSVDAESAKRAALEG